MEWEWGILSSESRILAKCQVVLKKVAAKAGPHEIRLVYGLFAATY